MEGEVIKDKFRETKRPIDLFCGSRLPAIAAELTVCLHITILAYIIHHPSLEEGFRG
jgi:hypothetical protein